MYEIPSINGLWEYQISLIRKNDPTQIPNISDVITSVPIVGEIEQNGEFVILTLEPNDINLETHILGTLTKTHISSSYNDYFWTLTFSNFNNNGILTLTASEVSSDDTVLEWKGHYTESGLSGISPYQFQTAGIATLKRIELTE